MARKETLQAEAKKRAALKAAAIQNADPSQLTWDEYKKAVAVKRGTTQIPSRILTKMRETWDAAQPKSAPNPNANPNTSTLVPPTVPGPGPAVTAGASAGGPTVPGPGPAVTTGTGITGGTPDTSTSGVTTGFNFGGTFYQKGQSSVGGNYDPTAKDSFELKSQLYTDPAAYAYNIKANLDQWRSEPSPTPGFNSKLDYLQALLRNTGSKGSSNRGILDLNDISHLKDMSKIAMANGVSVFALLQDSLGADSTAGKFSKTVSASLQLLDLGDATQKLSNHYFQAYGVYPSSKQIADYKNLYNAEAKRQQSSTTTTGGKGFSSSVTANEGFTAEEQNQFMNNYLVKNFNLNTKELGGDTKAIYDNIRSIYRSNLLPEPDFPSVAGQVKDLIGTADKATYQTKLDAIKKTAAQQAAKLYPSIAQDLLSGDLNTTAETFAAPVRNIIATKWGTTSAALQNDPEAQDLIKKSLAFKDKNGNQRMADATEINGLVQSTARWQAGPEAFTTYSNLADRIISGLKLQRSI